MVSILLVLFVNVLCLPLWTECDYGGFCRTLFTKEARIDLLYSGRITCAEPFQYRVTPKPFYATWRYQPGKDIHRANLSLRARGEWQKLSLQLEVLQDGKITMLFRGPDVQDEHGASYYPVLIDWRNVKLNGKAILPEQRAVSFIKSFVKQFSVKKGDLLHIEAEFCRHHFSIHDFTGLKSGMLWYIITGNIFFFFLTYRLLSYIRGGGIRRGDAFLLTIFFSLLFVPMIGVSAAVKSIREVRALAVKPELKDIFKEKSDYARSYENWFNDHFYGRVSLIKLHDVLRNKVSRIIRTKRGIYFKKDGWDFLMPFVQDMDCRSTTLQTIVRNVLQLDLFCRQNKIKFYVLEVPRKESIYKEFLSDKYGFDEKQFGKVSQAQETVRRDVRNHHIPYVYPYNALRKAVAISKDFVFFKCAHHWTDWGAFVGYCELMKEICKDFPDVPIVSLEDYKKSINCLYRDTYARDYGLPWHFSGLFNDECLAPIKKTSYNYYDHRDANKMVVKISEFTKQFTYPQGKYNVMLIGTSQNEELLQFLPYSVAQTKYLRLNMGQSKTADEFKILKLYAKDILAFKPDILILSISTDNFPRLRDICASK